MKIFPNKGKFNVFVIFLILAISTSLVGKLTSTYDKDIVFKLVVVDELSDKVIFDKSHDSVLLKVRGYGFNLAKYYLSTPELKISIKKLKELKNTFLWNQKDNFNDTKLNFDSSVELLTISEDSIFLYFDQYISQKKYIKPNVVISYSSGFDNFKTVFLSKDSVYVQGPKDVVNKIEYVESEKVILNNVNSDISLKLNLIKPAYDNITLDINSVNFELDVDQYTEEVISIPVNVISSSDIKFNYYPKELFVKYFISIDKYKKTTPMDFRIDCVFDENQNFLRPELIKQPDYIKNPRLSSNQIQLIILE